MKVKIKKYATWLGPYQLVEKIFFWARQKDALGIEREADWVYNIGDWLAHTWFGGWWSGVANNWTHYHGKRQVKVRIDPWDTWSMDHTLAYIVLPMLKQLKETKHGAPVVNNRDVPKELRSDAIEGDVSATHFQKWDWVLDEMIFAFESKHNDWEEQFHAGKDDTRWIDLDNGMSEMVKGPNDTFKIDWVGRKAYQKRITNGFRLFGTYFENLWD